MNKKHVALFAAIALSAAGLTAVNAADSSTTVDTTASKNSKFSGAQCAPGGKRGGGFVSALGITDAQLEKLNSLKMDFANSTGPKKEELKTLSRELRDDMTKPGVSKSDLLQLQGKINEIKNQLSISRVGYMADRMAVLTDDQKAKIRSFSLKRSFGPRHHGGKHFRGKFHGHGSKFGGKFGGKANTTQPAPSTPNEA